MRDHQRRQEQRGERIAAAESIARDRQCRRHREQERDEGGQRAEAKADPEGVDEFGVVRDRPEPAQRKAVGRQRQEAFGREGDETDHQDRRHHDDDEEGMEDQRQRAVPSHRNTSA
ncbi:hypothetical protein ABH979_006771 [Bradyrhizobium ottawaense]